MLCIYDPSNTANYIPPEKLDKLDKVAFLLRHGANVNSYSKYKITPLMAACRSGNIKNAKTLIRSGVDVNHKCSRGDTAYTYTICYREKKISRLLLSAGYDNLYGLSEKKIKFITEYKNSREYYDVKNDLFYSDASDLFSIVVLLSDDYYKL